MQLSSRKQQSEDKNNTLVRDTLFAFVIHLLAPSIQNFIPAHGSFKTQS